MSESTVQALEARLAALCGRRHAIMTGRASSALYLAFHALPARGGRIVFPAILCPSPVYVALYAGFEPLFCDISLADGNMNPEALERLLDTARDVAAVMPAHLYGQPCNMARIEAIAAQHGAAVIEDAAQALGGALDGRVIGSLGDISVLSFGHTKIIDIGYGGAVLTDNDGLADRLRAAAAELPATPHDLGELGANYRQTYYRLWEDAIADPSRHAEFLALPGEFRRLYIFGFDSARADELMTALDGLEGTIAERRRKAAIYADRIQGCNVVPVTPRHGGVPWRFNVLLDDGAQRVVTARLRRDGFDASNWYPALPKWFESGRRQDARQTLTAAAFERRVLNLWLDEATDEARIDACCAALERACSKAGACA